MMLRDTNFKDHSHISFSHYHTNFIMDAHWMCMEATGNWQSQGSFGCMSYVIVFIKYDGVNP